MGVGYWSPAPSPRPPILMTFMVWIWSEMIMTESMKEETTSGVGPELP